MGKCKVGLKFLLATLISALASGCGQEAVRIPDTTRPTVISTIPTNGATGVPFSQVVSAVFSKAMNPATINTASFTLTSGGGAVAGTVTYATTGSVASFTPAASLAPGTLFTATITTAAQDTAAPANSLAANYVWTFRTAVIPAPVPPTVISTTPANGATGVPVAQTVSIVFSEAMNPSTINGGSIVLQGPGGTAISGSVTYAGTTAIFTPAASLTPGTLYTGTVTTAAQDLAGDALAANYVWSFFTVVVPPTDNVPPTVISTVPINGATGVLPTATVSAVFSEPMNPATINATTFTLAAPGGISVAGTVAYAGTTATFTPGADLVKNILYTATITTGSQSVAGDALAANYVWVFKTGPGTPPPSVIATNPLNNATGVPINQAVTATFNEAVNPATVSTSTFKISGPDSAPVAGTVTYDPAGSVATFAPTNTLAPDSLFTATITTGVTDLAGNTLVANYIWSFTTGAGPETTLPTVQCTIPANNATGVPINQELYVCFSRPMNPTTINSSTFTLSAGGHPVLGVVGYTAGDATFTPTTNLAVETLYTATITTGAKDLAGNAIAVNYVWTFTTGDTPNTTDPTIVLTNPANGATGVAVNQTINATFSKPMDPTSLTATTFTLAPLSEGPRVTATVSYNPESFIASLTPTAALASNTTYTATVATSVTDLTGNPLAPGNVANPWTFTTGTLVIPPVPPLKAAALFAAFGSLGISNMGTSTVVNGDIGTTGVSTTITGFTDNTPGCTYTETPLNMGLVNGTINTAPPQPADGCPGEGTTQTFIVATQAAADAATAYAAWTALPGGLDVSTCTGCGGGSPDELGSRTLGPGTYKSVDSYSISLGDLTLDAHGDANAHWVFQMRTSLTVGTPSAHHSIILTNGAQAKNVFWQVGTDATINGTLGGGTMAGSVIALTGISVSTEGVDAVTTVNGRLMAIVGPLTLVNTVLNVPAP